MSSSGRAQSGSSAPELLTARQYAPAVQANYSTSAQVLAPIDAANLNTGDFVVPASGQVLVRVNGLVRGLAAFTPVTLALLDHTGGAQLGDSHYLELNNSGGSTSDVRPLAFEWLLSDLTPGEHLTLDIGWAVAATFTVDAQAQGITGTGSGAVPAATAAPWVFEVWSA